MLRAHAEIATSRVGYSSARVRLSHLEDAAAASERATELARLRFEEGGTDFLEVLDAERRQLEAQDRLAEGRALARDCVSSARALISGTLLPADCSSGILQRGYHDGAGPQAKN